MIDVSVDEARKIATVQLAINRRYEGKPKDIGIYSQMIGELKSRMSDIGFICEVTTKVNEHGCWMPIVDIVGRTDSKLQGIIDAEGIDIEQRTYEAKRFTSSELERQGVDTDLLLG